ncbi:hypothetical protein ABH974_006138 [Bradyrhizobium ottawaense]
MRDIEALAIHLVVGGIERLDLVVEPGALRTVTIGLTFQRQVRRQLQLETAAQPHLLRDIAVVEDIVVGIEGAVVDRDSPKISPVEVVAGDDPRRRVRSTESDRHQRRAPIGFRAILAILDRAPDLETVRDAIVELARHIEHLGIGVVGKAVERRTADVEAVVEALHIGAAARAVMRAERIQRIPGEISFVPDRSRVRLLGHKIDRPAGGALARDQRCRALQEFHGFQIGGVHDPRGHVLRTDLDAVVERVDLAVGEAAHREGGRLGRIIAGGDADRPLRHVGHGAITLLAHGLRGDHLDGRGRLAHRQAEPRGAFGHGIAVERRRGCRSRHGRLRHRCCGRRPARCCAARALRLPAGRLGLLAGLGRRHLDRRQGLSGLLRQRSGRIESGKGCECRGGEQEFSRSYDTDGRHGFGPRYDVSGTSQRTRSHLLALQPSDEAECLYSPTDIFACDHG